MQFLHESIAVLADRLRADLQRGGDLLVALPSAMSWSTSFSRGVNTETFSAVVSRLVSRYPSTIMRDTGALK